ncbi:MAG TPA: tRNA epoxyqueuosine(34) reductase QueG [Bauldia sp.]|nr:tRNA epoxyqueuosine(34) reductase QueG [Bauldia sp.]
MVRAPEVAPVLPRPAVGSGEGRRGSPALRRPGFLSAAQDPRPVRYPPRGTGTPAEIKAAFLADCRRAGFDVAGVAAPDAVPEAAARLREFLAAGRHGTMTWLEAEADRRSAPRSLWPEVDSVVMVGLNYGPAHDPLAALALRDRGVVSVYAQNRDYHDLVRGRLKELAGRFKAKTGSEVKVFVDTAPLMEKPLAAAAGLGWQGKHTNLVSREFGSWLFLGAIAVAMKLPADAPVTDSCGTCRACLDVCPTKAFPAPYQLDARRCISYLTIEHEGPIPHEFRKAIGNRIYGCDDCLAVCPWNKFASVTREAKLAARADRISPRLADLAALDDDGFRAMFAASPIKRIGRDRFVRNVMIAVGNSGDPALRPVAEACTHDASPLVAEAASWALAELGQAR